MQVNVYGMKLSNQLRRQTVSKHLTSARDQMFLRRVKLEPMVADTWLKVHT